MGAGHFLMSYVRQWPVELAAEVAELDELLLVDIDLGEHAQA